MGKFRDVERPRQAFLKKTSPYFSDAARADGVYRKKPRDFCLRLECTEENLFSQICSSVTAYFAREEIKWHGGRQQRPSNHMCDSQVCCVNFPFPFADKPQALVDLLRPAFPDIREVLPMEDKAECVSQEWIDLDNYLGEKLPRHGKRTRGALFTSADAAVMFEHQDGLRRIVLIEWKYAEAYSSSYIRFAKSGTDRLEIFRHLLNRDDCPLDKTVLPNLDALFHDPFDQLMRQQLLAREMERTQELGAQLVSVLHIAPAHNVDYPRVTSPSLQSLGQTVIGVWKCLVRKPDTFTSKSTEELFGRFPIERFPELARWWEYVTARYSWLSDNAATDFVASWSR